MSIADVLRSLPGFGVDAGLVETRESSAGPLDGAGQVMPGLAASQVRPAMGQPPPRPSGPAWLQAMAPLFAIGARVGGAPQVGTGALQGAEHANRVGEEQRRHEVAESARRFQLETQARLQETALAERTAQEKRLRDAEERRLADARADFMMKARVNAAQFKTREEFDAFLNFAEATGLETLGLRPGALRQHVEFVPPAMRERAVAQLGRLRSSWKAEGRDPATLGGIHVKFDIDGDGKPETVPYRQLQEFAQEAVFTPDGKPYTAAPPRKVTFGEAFKDARGTVLADKPMPTTSTGDPDYSRGLADLQRALRLKTPARGESRAQAQASARADFEAAVLAGESLDRLTPRFSPVLKPLGLNVAVEYARIRQRLFGVGARATPESSARSTTSPPRT